MMIAREDEVYMFQGSISIPIRKSQTLSRCQLSLVVVLSGDSFPFGLRNSFQGSKVLHSQQSGAGEPCQRVSTV